MIEFHRLTPQDRALYQLRLSQSGEKSCEYSFVNINLWGRQRVAFLENHAVLFSQFGQRSVYPFPIGQGDMKPALDAILADAQQRGIPCRIVSMTEQDCQTLDALYPGKFRFHTDHDGRDYVYRIEDLATLKGKRYQSKRNFVNRFKANHPNCQVLPIDETNLPATRDMVQRWYAERTREDPSSDFLLEQTALERAFRHLEDFELDGLVLMEEGQVLAMTLGSHLSNTTFDVHFEKAMDRGDGAYAAINYEFANYLHAKYPHLQYLNREDDMGLPGLRKAKLSYHPDHLMEKHWARFWEDADEEL